MEFLFVSCESDVGNRDFMAIHSIQFHSEMKAFWIQIQVEKCVISLEAIE